MNGITRTLVCLFFVLFSFTAKAYQIHFAGSIVEEACEITNDQSKIISDCHGLVNKINYKELLKDGSNSNKQMPDGIKSFSLTKINDQESLFYLDVEYL